MSKPMKEMIVSAYQSRLGETEEALIVSLRGVKAEGTEAIRNKMREGSVEVTVVKNSLARKAFEGTALSALSPLALHPSRSATARSSALVTEALFPSATDASALPWTTRS